MSLEFYGELAYAEAAASILPKAPDGYAKNISIWDESRRKGQFYLGVLAGKHDPLYYSYLDEIFRHEFVHDLRQLYTEMKHEEDLTEFYIAAEKGDKFASAVLHFDALTSQLPVGYRASEINHDEIDGIRADLNFGMHSIIEDYESFRLNQDELAQANYDIQVASATEDIDDSIAIIEGRIAVRKLLS